MSDRHTLITEVFLDKDAKVVAEELWAAFGGEITARDRYVEGRWKSHAGPSEALDLFERAPAPCTYVVVTEWGDVWIKRRGAA